ncbi:MAG: serine hydroxymethyltransferase [Candidatus Heimdallarchaeota archaeon]|nr:serine hydroxymethyltransferase [Candidatus Heimdallarchaeota archaeon]
MKEHHNLFARAIPLIASENVTSLEVREATVSDFMHRYAEGWPGERVYAGCQYIDDVEFICMDLAKEVFGAKFADVRPISGVVANLVLYSAFSQPGDISMSISIPCGGHISTGPMYTSTGNVMGGTAGAVRGLDVKYIPFDRRELVIDTEKAKEAIKELEPKLLHFGASVFLFPHPIKELAPVAKDLGATVTYDAAHVSGLIACGYFQDPLNEGADAMSFSTHKTLFGPQHGTVVAATDDEEVTEKIKRATFPGLTSNHHLHNVAGLAIALAEIKEFGKEYGAQVIKNAQAIAKALEEEGFTVCGKNKGYTKSHTILVDISPLEEKAGLGKDIEEDLEEADIILNRNLLPWDMFEGRHYMNPGGIRLGTSEITRLGMKENEMKQIAKFIRRVVIDREEPKKVAKEVNDFREEYQTIHYCFTAEEQAYKYKEFF